MVDENVVKIDVKIGVKIILMIIVIETLISAPAHVAPVVWEGGQE